MEVANIDTSRIYVCCWEMGVSGRLGDWVVGGRLGCGWETGLWVRVGDMDEWDICGLLGDGCEWTGLWVGVVKDFTPLVHFTSALTLVKKQTDRFTNAPTLERNRTNAKLLGVVKRLHRVTV